MKLRSRLYGSLLGISLAVASSTALALSPGQKLSKTQVSQWGPLTVYEIGSTRLRLIPAEHSGSQKTLLLNARNIVGTSSNEVAIAEAGPEAQNIIQQTLPRPVSVQHYEPTGITVATYANFDQAVQAQQALKAALPNANVKLPVNFRKPPVPY